MIGWHIADEAGISKQTRLYGAYSIIGFVAAITAVQIVRFVHL